MYDTYDLQRPSRSSACDFSSSLSVELAGPSHVCSPLYEMLRNFYLKFEFCMNLGSVRKWNEVVAVLVSVRNFWLLLRNDNILILVGF